MKHVTISILILLVSFSSYAQNKIRGSRNVVVETREALPFNRLIVSSDIDVILSQGHQVGLEVEADDNLIESIYTEVKDSVLEIHLLDDVTRSKALKVHVSVNSPIFILETRDKSNVSGASTLVFEEFYLLAQNHSSINLNINAPYVDMKFYDKSKNDVILSNNELAKVYAEGSSSVDLNLTSQELKASLQGSSDIKLTGNAITLELSSLEKSDFEAKEFVVEDATLNTSDHADVSVNVSKKLTISAQQNSEIDIYGNPSYDILLFTDKATLNKK